MNNDEIIKAFELIYGALDNLYNELGYLSDPNTSELYKLIDNIKRAKEVAKILGEESNND